MYRNYYAQLRGFWEACRKPYWQGQVSSGSPVGIMRPDLESELFLWRPVIAGKLQASCLYDGTIDLVGIMKLNSLLDWEAACQKAQMDKEARR